MSTLLAKIAVFITVALSLGMCGLAVAIYTNQINWSGPIKPVPPDLAGGMVATRKAALDQAVPLAQTAAASYAEEKDRLAAEELNRPSLQYWYAAQLDALEGQDKNGKPIQVLAIGALAQNPQGGLQMDPQGHPLLRQTEDTKALRPRIELEQLLKQVRAEIAKTIAIIADLQKQHEMLTLEINGNTKKNTRGLKDLVRGTRQATEKADDEYKALKPHSVNRQVEAQILGKRGDALRARIEELKKANARASGPASK